MSKLKLKLTFDKDCVTRPIIYDLVKKYDVMTNILNANIEYGNRGNMILEIKGKEDNLKLALEYFDSLKVKYEIYAEAIVWDEARCINCGSCTAVCPTQALYMGKDDLLHFDKDKCVVCQLCINACPLKIISVEL
ncbi:MAG: 4Fe-4S binding protein [Clostridia bacterium]|jgi:ferredoxin|nr:4Fe-4S binding protein [Clostridia bacterium]MDD4543428.1 4Fe-4S binding protein [Clostridia bacterium]NLF36384.1 4Fe-4S binding protein [Clostridiaceae bacterium]HXK71423.1 4Fe-4S binding protein [Clostridia bacterium]